MVMEKGTMINFELINLFKDSDTALIFKQIYDWISFNSKNKNKKVNTYFENRYWCFQTYEQLQEKFSWLSVRTIIRKIKKLENLGVLISKNFNKYKMDKTKWYSIDYEKLEYLLKGEIKEETKEKVKEEIKGELKEKANNNFVEIINIESMTDNEKVVLEIINSINQTSILRVNKQNIPAKNIINEVKKLSQKDLKSLICFTAKRFEKKATSVEKKSAYIKSIFVNALLTKEYLTENIEFKNHSNNSSNQQQRTVVNSKFVNYKQKDLDYDSLRKIEEKSLADNKKEEKYLPNDEKEEIQEDIFEKYKKYKKDTLIYNIYYVLEENKNKFYIGDKKLFENLLSEIVSEVVKVYIEKEKLNIDSDPSTIEVDEFDMRSVKSILENIEYILKNDIKINIPEMSHLRLPF